MLKYPRSGGVSSAKVDKNFDSWISIFVSSL